MCVCVCEGESEWCVCVDPKLTSDVFPNSSVFMEAGILACQMSPHLADFAISAGKSKLDPYSYMTATSTKPSLL